MVTIPRSVAATIQRTSGTRPEAPRRSSRRGGSISRAAASASSRGGMPGSQISTDDRGVANRGPGRARPGSGRGLLAAVYAQDDVAQLDHVAVLQTGAADLLSVHDETVRALGVRRD